MSIKGDKGIRLLLVVCNNVMNGSERYVVDLAKHLPKDKFSVTVAVPTLGPLSDILRENNIKEVIYNNGRENKYSLKGLFNLFKTIHKEKYHIVHANAGILPCMIAKLLNVRLIIEIKHGIFYTDEQLVSMSPVRKIYEITKQFFVHYFIAISQNDKQRLIDHFKVKDSKIKVIYNGLDTEGLYKSEITPIRLSEESHIVIGCIGRLTFQKAQEVLINAFYLLRSECDNVILVLIGTGEDEIMLKSLVRKMKLEGQVIFQPYKQNIFDYLKGFDILALSSRYEGVPYVILEAMELNIPIVSTDVGGINNILTNRINAYLVEVDNPGKLKEALLLLIREKS